MGRFERTFCAVWWAVRTNVGSMAFEKLADALRADAARRSRSLGDLRGLPGLALGDSQRFQLRRALELHHYPTPKLLLLASLVRLRLDGEPIGRGADVVPLSRGAPPRMAPLEMVSERPADRHLRKLLGRIQRVMQLPEPSSVYRTLALWPDYLDAAWGALEPIARSGEYARATQALLDASRAACRELPAAVALPPETLSSLGEDVEAFSEISSTFEAIAPPLVLNVALLSAEVLGKTLERSPYPPHLPGEPAEVPAP